MCSDLVVRVFRAVSRILKNAGQLAHDFQKHGPTIKNGGQHNLSLGLLIFTCEFYRFPFIFSIYSSTALTGTDIYQ